MTGLAVGGCQLILFGTGVGNTIGNMVAPTIKVSGNINTVRILDDDIDFDVSSILESGVSISKMGRYQRWATPCSITWSMWRRARSPRAKSSTKGNPRSVDLSLASESLTACLTHAFRERPFGGIAVTKGMLDERCG